ncbi:uncharacterized protein LOC142983678 [Anticarsia gemmatalis]|uniref:uncharacterized protein LOC142983678 n=1 Tax=Anticarsia gemmatalis TaxID=129554 RepID=UPI003F777528
MKYFLLIGTYGIVKIILLYTSTLTLAQDTDYEDLYIDGMTPRPPPESLLIMLANNTDRDEDLTACMNDYASCQRLHEDTLEPICGIIESLTRTFANMCILLYENCKIELALNPRPQLGRASGPRWQYIADGACTF